MSCQPDGPTSRGNTDAVGSAPRRRVVVDGERLQTRARTLNWRRVAAVKADLVSRIDAAAAEPLRLSDRFDGYNMRLTDAMTESPAAASNSAPGSCFGSAYARGVLEVRQHVGVRDDVEGMRGEAVGAVRQSLETACVETRRDEAAAKRRRHRFSADVAAHRGTRTRA